MILKKLTWAAASIAFAVVLAIQLVPIERTNPPLRGALTAPAQIQGTLRRACYDCHSDETHWPWYSHVAPFSWLINRDVTLGRKEVNFSEWGSYYAVTRRRKLEWMGRALREEKMPPLSYRLMHPDSRLTETDRAALERWIDSALATNSVERSGK